MPTGFLLNPKSFKQNHKSIAPSSGATSPKPKAESVGPLADLSVQDTTKVHPGDLGGTRLGALKTNWTT